MGAPPAPRSPLGDGGGAVLPGRGRPTAWRVARAGAAGGSGRMGGQLEAAAAGGGAGRPAGRDRGCPVWGPPSPVALLAGWRGRLEAIRLGSRALARLRGRRRPLAAPGKWSGLGRGAGCWRLPPQLCGREPNEPRAEAGPSGSSWPASPPCHPRPAGRWDGPEAAARNPSPNTSYVCSIMEGYG